MFMFLTFRMFYRGVLRLGEILALLVTALICYTVVPEEHLPYGQITNVMKLFLCLSFVYAHQTQKATV